MTSIDTGHYFGHQARYTVGDAGRTERRGKLGHGALAITQVRQANGPPYNSYFFGTT